MLDFGKAFNYWIDQTHLANEGARWAVVNSNPGSGAGQTLQQYVQSQADSSELRNGGTSSIPTKASVCIAFPSGTSNVGDPVKVTVSVTYNWLPFFGTNFSILGGKPLKVTNTTMSATSTMRLEGLPTKYSAGCYP